MIMLHDVLDSSVGPHEFQVNFKNDHAELWLPGVSEPFIVTKLEPSVRFSIVVPGEPRPIRMKAWLLNKG